MLYHCTIIILWCWFAAAEAHRLVDNAGNFAEGTPFPKQPRHRIPVPSLYYRRYSEQTFIATHNSVAIRTEENNWSLSGNQYFNISVQLSKQIDGQECNWIYKVATYCLI